MNSHKLPLIFPVHPRTAKIIAGLGITHSRLHMIEPMGYLEFNYTEQKIRSQSKPTETTQKTTRKTTQKTTQKILDLLRENPNASRKELALMLENITENGFKYHLK